MHLTTGHWLEEASRPANPRLKHPRRVDGRLGIGCEEPEELPVKNRFVYSAVYKIKRDLDHEGQDAVMFFVRVPQDCLLRLQAEEIVEARWFNPDETGDAYPVKKQRSLFQECMAASCGPVSSRRGFQSRAIAIHGLLLKLAAS